MNHVKGHHDSNKETISWVEQLNVESYGLADEAKFKDKPKETHYPAQVVSLWMAGHQVTTGIDRELEQKWSQRGTRSLN